MEHVLETFLIELLVSSLALASVWREKRKKFAFMEQQTNEALPQTYQLLGKSKNGIEYYLLFWNESFNDRNIRPLLTPLIPCFGIEMFPLFPFIYVQTTMYWLMRKKAKGNRRAAYILLVTF